MDGITASPHSVVTKRDLSVITEHVSPAIFFFLTSFLASSLQTDHAAVALSLL
jgi:hypothetical protein